MNEDARSKKAVKFRTGAVDSAVVAFVINLALALGISFLAELPAFNVHLRPVIAIALFGALV